ncbi:MAG TPA: class I tRNA ligase family protein, partial [Pyrinomonadaceae bacterium]
RCRTVVEPLISMQWWCKQGELARRGLEFIKERHEPHFYPEVPWEKVYTDWLENLHDWTLSRQLWWGHRIPAWYDADGRVYVARSEEEARAAAGTDQLTQDPDVLDTWFSSALWPISTLGWPEQTADLETFYPTDVLVTARDIIFLWVSRMVMTGTKFTGRLPFRDVVITGTVLDKHGQKMAKMKGNVIDPMDVFEKYGVDATRVTLAASSAGTDFPWRDERVESYRNFANKIWNAARFCLLNSEGAQVGRGFEGERAGWALHDRWIVSRLNKTTQAVERALSAYQFHEAVYALYHFFWDDFCDWYIEFAKTEVTAVEESAARAAARSRVLTVLEQALRLLHPFMPFITEELWQRLPGVGTDSLHPAYAGAEPTIMLAAYPRVAQELIDERAEAEMQAVIELVSRVRSIRSEMNIKPSEEVELLVSAPDAAAAHVFDASLAQIKRLARAASVTFKSSMSDVPRHAARAVLAGGVEVALPLEGLIDFEQERARVEREREKLAKEAERLAAQLANPQFTERAPAEKVADLRQRVADIAQRMKALEQTLEALA